MSEDKKDTKEPEYDFEFVTLNSKISIELDGEFFLRLQKVYHRFCRLFKDEKTLKEALDLATSIKIYQDFPKDKRSAYDLQTLIFLIQTIDDKFREEKLFTTEKLSINESSIQKMCGIWFDEEDGLS